MKTRIQITKLEALHLLAALNIASETTQEASYQTANLNLRKKILKAIDRTADLPPHLEPYKEIISDYYKKPIQ